MATHLAELSPAQRQIVLPFFAAAGVGSSGGGSSGGPATTTAAARTGQAPVAQLIALLAGPTPSPTQPIVSAIQAKVKEAVTVEGLDLGHSLGDTPVGAGPGAVHVVFAAQDLAISDNKAAPAWMWATHGVASIDSAGDILADFEGSVTDCYVFVGPGMWTHWEATLLQEAVLYHEVFHCYQAFVIGHFTATSFYDAPVWVKEGGADWAAASAVTGFNEPAFQTYLLTPDAPLGVRAYTAVGFFFEEQYLGRTVWTNWWKIWTDAALGGWSTTDWFVAITGNFYDATSKAWASSFYQNQSLGHDWTVTAPSQDVNEMVGPTPFSGQLDVSGVPYSTNQVSIPQQSSGTVVVISASPGTTRFIDANNRELVNATFIALCWSNCTCPNGSVSPGQSSLFEVSGEVRWAMTSLAQGGQAILQAVNLADLCKKKKDDYKPPSAPPCSNACAGSNGDPHMVTVNLRRYDFQAAGEFVLARSADGSVEIQGRQEPPSGSTSGVTLNTAVAARVGTHRVGVYLTDSGLTAQVDGKTVSSTTDLGGGAGVAVHRNGIEVDLPDGTTLWALPVGSYGINIQIRPSLALRDQAVGMLGRLPLSYAAPLLPDGTGIKFGTTPAQLYDFKYHRLADAWRVTDQSSLFDYTSGRNTASYSPAGFVPEGGPNPMVLDPSNRASSETACQAVNDVELHDNCVFDVTVTGNAAFVSGYQITEAFQTTGTPALEQAPSGPSTTIGGAAGALSGITELLPSVIGLEGSAASPDGTIYATVLVAPLPGTSELLAIDPTTATIRNRVSLDAPGGLFNGIAFAAGSVWLITRFTTCNIIRVDPSTLQTQATIALAACPSATPAIAAAGDAIWTNDPTGGSGAQGHLLRFDPATNKLAGSVAVPNPDLTPAGSGVLGGSLHSSSTSLFWGIITDTYRVQSPWTAADDLHAPSGVVAFPAGDGIWVQSDPVTANLYGGTGGQQASASISGQPVGADATNLYVDQRGQQGTSELWRYPADGSTPVVIASVPDQNMAPWTASGDPRSPLIITANAAMKVDALVAPSGQSQADQNLGLYLERVPLH